jgi:hypothetical protein
MGSKMVRWQRRLMFRFCKKTMIRVRWPIGAVMVEDDHVKWDSGLGTVRQEIYSADPNDHYRPELEQLVGEQGVDWQWHYPVDNMADTHIGIEFAPWRESWASYFAMKWN